MMCLAGWPDRDRLGLSFHRDRVNRANCLVRCFRLGHLEAEPGMGLFFTGFIVGEEGE